MNKQYIIIGGIVAFLVGAMAFVYIAQSNKPAEERTTVTTSTTATNNATPNTVVDPNTIQSPLVTPDTGEPAEEEPALPDTDEDAETPSEARYVDYSAEEFKKVKGTKILFFSRTSCPQCAALDKSIKKGVDTLTQPVTIFKVDFNDDKKIRDQYGVSQPTTCLKLNDSNKVEAVHIGFMTPTFAALSTALLLQ